jgi:type VI secretion system protein ImpH
LRALLADYFGYPVTIEEFVGEWVELPEDGRWRLGVSREVSSLGFTTVIGRRMWRCDHKFRVVLGPLKREELRGLLPGTPTLDRLSALVRAYVGDEFEWDVRLILAEDASNQVKLGRGDRLGWYARLGKRTRHTRREDVIVHPASHRTQRSAAQQ